MQIDELILKLKSDFNKVVSDANSLISKFTKLDNSTSKVSSDFENISKSASSMGNGFKASERNIESLERQLSRMKSTFTEHVSLYRQWGDLATTKTPDNIKGLSGEEVSKSFGSSITRDSLLQERQEIDALQGKISELKAQVSSVPKLKVVPNTKEGEQNLKNVGNEANKTGRKFDNLKSKTGKIGNIFSNVGKSLKSLKGSFGNLGSMISSSMDKNFKSIKKLALGLIGVRTVMSLLTRSVNAYLSFDSELQDSLTNSWNMLGSLLAPAIELVANLFATATNYIYQFVQALTGIDLVARANAKALQTQAKATKKTADAQRGLLGMDEITNLPTEPGGKGTETPQIKVKGVDAKGIFKDLIDAFKQHKWHRAGEIIAEGINRGLRKIQWDKVRERAEKTGKNIADFLNGVFELDWRLLGSSIANAINTAIDFIHGFVTKLEWGRIGAGIGDALVSFFETFDFNKLADSINNTAMGIMNMFYAFLTHLDPEMMGNKIAEFLLKIKWKEIGEMLVKVLLKWIEVSLRVQWSMITTLSQNLAQQLSDRLYAKLTAGGRSLGQGIAHAFVSALKSVLNNLIWSMNRMLNPVGTMIDAMYKATGKKSGIKLDWIPYLATGTNNIESEGIYHLHEGEAVVPKKYNPATGGYNDGNDNREIINLLVALNSTMLEYAERPIRLDINGRKVAEGIYDDIQSVGRNKNTSTAITRS